MVRKYILHIFFVAFALVMTASCGKGGRVIPRGTMAKIYAEMFMTDQWVHSDYKMRRIADTALVYEPVFDKYGYTSEDYRRSMSHYMDDPDRYARILKESAVIIEERIQELKAEQSRLQALSESKAATDAFIPEKIFYLSGLANKDLVVADSLVFYIDSTGGEFCFDVQKGYDTLYVGPRLVFQEDTVAVNTIQPESAVAQEQNVDPKEETDVKNKYLKLKQDNNLIRRIRKLPDETN